MSVLLPSSMVAATRELPSPEPTSSTPVRFASSDKVEFSGAFWSSIAQANAARFSVRETSPLIGTPGQSQPFDHDADGSLARTSAAGMPPPSLSFDGVANLDNGLTFNYLIIPPDMNGDVGPQQYVQIVNSLIRVFDKTGNPLSAPFKLSNVFTPLGTVCSTRNDGLPIALYDAFADRWLISQTCTAFPPFRQMVAISKTGDPLGGYYLYEFVMPGVRLNDFPKFGVWPDGYYMSSEEYLGSDFVGAGAFAFDRNKMLAGDPTASYIYFRFPIAAPYRHSTLLPSDLDGMNAPPAGAPNIFATYTATEYGDAQDAIRLFDFHADFASPEQSTFIERPESPLAVAAFDPTSPDGRADITQPPPGEFLDSSSDRLNYRLAYRNFGNYQSLALNQTVRTSAPSAPYRAGVRVYELHKTSGPFSVHEQATIGDDVSSRWVASTAQDRNGNLAVQYNSVTDEKVPSILYTGKLASDPAGTFRTENALVNGTGVQKGFGWRWGEFSGLSVDPLNDCDFWATNAYYTLESQTFSDFGWLTRIGRFRFSECTPQPLGKLNVKLTDAVTGAPLANGTVRIFPNLDLNASPFMRSTNSAGRLESMLVPPNQYTVEGSFPGYGSRSGNTTITAGSAANIDLALEPIPMISSGLNEILSESCRIDHATEPGETVNVSINLRNSGAADTADLVGTLLASGGITNPSAPQNYGRIRTGGISKRFFTFTVSSAVHCGAPITITLRLQDGSVSLGDVSFQLSAGETKYAFRENFDGVTAPALPDGWTTSASENHQPWRTATTRVQSQPNAMYSPAPYQMGQNELVSPVFPIVTPNAELSFRNWYDLETTFLRNRLYDGSVLEIRYDGGAWQDIITSGGAFISGGYDGTIDGCCQNPLAGRLGWSGRSGVNQTSEYITSRVKLPTAAVGHNVQLRWRIGSDIGGTREGQYLDDLAVTDGYSCACTVPQSRALFDFDGDGKTDLSLVDLNDAGPDYKIIRSSDSSLQTALWGASGDIPSNADFDGDGRTDLAVFRPSTGAWYILPSSNAAQVVINFGLAGDRVIPADFDGDGKADIAVFRPSNGTWYVLRSGTGQVSIYRFGLAGDVPLQGDFDGDSKADFAVYRPSDGTWYIAKSSDGEFIITRFGLSTDKPVPGDFDGDGKTDIAVFRASTGIWYLLKSTQGFAAIVFGSTGDTPLQADFDGDGKRDISVFRASTNIWWRLNSSDGNASAQAFGDGGDMPVPSIFIAQ